MNPNEEEYLNGLVGVLSTGREKSDRTGVGTISLTGLSSRYDLSKGFPLLTTKRMFWRGIVAELLWFLAGDTNANTLRRQGVFFWDEWAGKNGELGPIYGKQWRAFGSDSDPMWVPLGLADGGTDQIADLLDGLKANPLSRRHVITTWNPAELDDMALPPCHGLTTQFVCEPLTLEERAAHVGEAVSLASSGDSGPVARHLDQCGAPRYRLSCVMHQRSGDMFLGVPFNIASYSLLTQMIAAECNMVPGEFVHTIGDAHIYLNHVDQVKKQLSREPLEPPSVSMIWHYDDFDGPGAGFSVLGAKAENIVLRGYQHHPTIKAPVAV